MERKEMEKAIGYDPFDGEWDTDVLTLSDKIVKTREPAYCHACDCSIGRGSLVRSRTDKVDGKICSYKFCTHCTEAMAQDMDDDGERYIDRVDEFAPGVARLREAEQVIHELVNDLTCAQGKPMPRWANKATGDCSEMDSIERARRWTERANVNSESEA